ncbi:hypothetical protein [Desulforhopalus sp. 52FAK]
MSIVEIISLRGTTTLSEEFCRTLMSRVHDQRKQTSQPEIKTYRMKNVESDVSFHLIWTSTDIKWEKSDFGVSLARYLKEFGLVSHSVWQQLQPV